MAYKVVLAAEAITDIDNAVAYYNGLSNGLGFEFADTIDNFFKKIANLPTASAIRYDNIRVKPIDTFPFTIHFTIADEDSVIILRVFNSSQKPVG